MFTNYTEEELNQLILNQVEENIHLDYKGAGSLALTDGKKKEISKDISAFANSDGGTIIYGICEFNETTKRHLPEKIDSIDRVTISKEWLEQVINSNIQPKIAGILIHPIPLNLELDKVVYVVTIPKSNTAHQASDKKYYKRYNFESVAMEDYEIKDIINRQTNPDLVVMLNHDELTNYNSNVLKFPINIYNNSIKLAKDVKIMITLDDSNNYNVEGVSGFDNLSHINNGKRVFSTNSPLTIYNGITTSIGNFQIRLNENVTNFKIECRIFCDNMKPIIDNFEINIENNIPKYYLTEKSI